MASTYYKEQFTELENRLKKLDRVRVVEDVTGKARNRWETEGETSFMLFEGDFGTVESVSKPDHLRVSVILNRAVEKQVAVDRKYLVKDDLPLKQLENDALIMNVLNHFPRAEDMAVFKCPITAAILKDPVVASDGRTYEKSALEAASNGTEPLISNHNMNSLLKALVEDVAAQQRAASRQAAPQAKAKAVEATAAAAAAEPEAQASALEGAAPAAAEVAAFGSYVVMHDELTVWESCNSRQIVRTLKKGQKVTASGDVQRAAGDINMLPIDDGSDILGVVDMSCLQKVGAVSEAVVGAVAEPEASHQEIGELKYQAFEKNPPVLGAGHTVTFKCPLSLDFFRDPVVASDGHTYEREQIMRVLQVNRISPITREPLSLQLFTNRAMKALLSVLIQKAT